MRYKLVKFKSERQICAKHNRERHEMLRIGQVYSCRSLLSFHLLQCLCCYVAYSNTRCLNNYIYRWREFWLHIKLFQPIVQSKMFQSKLK